MKKYFDYLDELRESGRTNMYCAVPYLLDHFPELFGDTKRAKKTRLSWIDNCKNGGDDR